MSTIQSTIELAEKLSNDIGALANQDEVPLDTQMSLEYLSWQSLKTLENLRAIKDFLGV